MDQSLMGLLIGAVRTKKGISLKALSKGVCSAVNLSRIEAGERNADQIVLDCLWQRLGESVEQFSMILDQEDYELWGLRHDIAESVFAKQFSTAKELLAQYEKKTRDKKCLMNQQFLGYYNLIIWEEEGYPLEKLYMQNQKVIEITVSSGLKGWKDSLLGQMELLLIFNSYRILEKMGDKAKAFAGYQDLMAYMEQHGYERMEKKNIFPQICYRLASILIEQHDYSTAEPIAAEAVRLLRSTEGATMFLPELLLILAECREQKDGMTSRRARMYRLYGGFLKKYLDSIDPLRQYTDIHPKYKDCEAYAFKDVVKSRREYMGLSQEKLAEGICSPVTMSRLETGKNSPQKKVMQKLLDKLGLSGECYSGYFITDNLKAYDEFEEIRMALNLEQPEIARRHLATFMKLVDIRKVTNRQIVDLLGAFIDNCEKKLSTDQLIQMLEEFFTYGLGKYKPEKIKGCFLTPGEKWILLSMANEYKRMQKYDKAFEVMEILQREDRTPVKYINEVGLLGNYLGDLGKYEEGNKKIREAEKTSVIEKDCWYIGYLLYTKAWNIEQMAENKKRWCMHIYLLSYLFFHLCNTKYGKELVLLRCKKNYPPLARRIVEEFSEFDV